MSVKRERDTSHVVFQGSEAVCLHCAARLAAKLPMDVGAFVLWSRKFIKLHQDCPSPVVVPAQYACCFCRADLTGKSTVGAGDGNGSRYACEACACEHSIRECAPCRSYKDCATSEVRAARHKAWRPPCPDCAALRVQVAELQAELVTVRTTRMGGGEV